ncbi:DNA-directed RNA polymerase subunit H [Candidatus Woesearchaeota archaeon]|nr:DNA-directed RNA polymerase subunit H [Candidatus Woesearchaeota archaeon]
MPKKKIVIKKHVLMPKHVKLIEKEKKDLLERYKISLNELPKIIKNDSAIVSLNVKIGDVVKITRESPTAGEITYYRVVVNG